MQQDSRLYGRNKLNIQCAVVRLRCAQKSLWILHINCPLLLPDFTMELNVPGNLVALAGIRFNDVS
jgi:hypothetical protein